MITGEELAAYAAGEADPALVARVESALPDDPSLAGRLERIRQVDELLGAVDPITMSTAETDRLTAAIERDLAGLAAAPDVEGVPGDELVGLSARGATGPGRSGRGSGRTGWWEWLDPMRLAGAAAALVVVIGVGAVVLNGMGGGDDSATDSAAPAADTAESLDGSGEALMPLPSTAEESLDSAARTATEAATDAATETAEGADEFSSTAAAAEGLLIPVVDDARVVLRAADIDPTPLRQRLEALVDLDAIQEPAADDADGAAASEPPSDAVGIADGRVSATDREAVDACLPVAESAVIVAEVIVLAPDRAAIIYLLDDRAVVVDADTCGLIADLEG